MANHGFESTVRIDRRIVYVTIGRNSYNISQEVMSWIRTVMIGCAIALSLLFTLPTFIHPAQSAPALAAAVKADPEFKVLLDRYYAAWSSDGGNIDFDTAGQFYVHSDELLVYDPMPPLGGFQGWNALKAGDQNAFGNFTHIKLTPYDDLKVTRHGDVAWCTLTYHLSLSTKTGEGGEYDLRHTIIWEKREGQWLIVHEHASVPLPV